MSNKFLHIFLMLVIAGWLTGCSRDDGGKRLPSLEETYSRTDKNPFGTYVAYQQMENMFSRNTIREKRQPFDKTWAAISDTGSLYISFSKFLFVNEDEAKAMMDYVYAGNTLFIAANYFDTVLLSKIKCKENYSALPYLQYDFFDSVRTTNTSSNDSAFSYYYHPFKSNFEYRDSVFTKVLGVNDENKPNYILYFHGKGKLFLHCDPKAFSNYFLLKNDNYKYLQNSFAYTANYPDHLYWDDYYRKIGSRRSSESSLSAILNNPPLAWAFWLILLLGLLYVLFGGKRRQRIIDKIKPNENTTVTFTETIGRLYLQQKDNKNIAEKMSTYFNEYVRNNYFLNTNLVNDDFITSLSRKSGVDRNKVESLYRAIHHVQSNAAVDDYQLLSLNEQIQNFYKQK
ncbi:DUF4350 domain-containing protein [Ferruginibacter sp. SUN106]|uniref:DUF4350 domain-containing protein n=1 Tax=Ferruginibacter sp. SUN106 TaxID=2978348 RepID=UPI003D35E4FC